MREVLQYFQRKRAFVSLSCVLRNADSALLLKPYTLNRKKSGLFFFLERNEIRHFLGEEHHQRHDAFSVLK